MTRGNKGADGVRTTLICVDTYDGGAMSGRVYVPGMDGAGVFENLMQLLALIDGMKSSGVIRDYSDENLAAVIFYPVKAIALDHQTDENDREERLDELIEIIQHALLN